MCVNIIYHISTFDNAICIVFQKSFFSTVVHEYIYIQRGFVLKSGKFQVWDHELASRAQQWANECTWGHDMLTEYV